MPLLRVTLPLDVIHLILDHLRDLRDALAVSSVTRAWREIALRNATLWSYINAQQYQSALRFSRSLPVILSRSRDRPLDVSFWQSERLWTWDTPFPSVLLSEFQRLRTLFLVLRPQSSLFQTTLDFPQLEELVVRVAGGVGCTLDIRAPTLVSLLLLSARVSNWEHIISPKLRSLDVEKARIECPDLLRLLRKCTQLEHLCVMDPEFGPLLEDWKLPGCRIVVPYLGVRSTLSVLERLRTPSCSPIRGRVRFFVDYPFADDFVSFFPTWLEAQRHRVPCMLGITSGRIQIDVPDPVNGCSSSVGLLSEHEIIFDDRRLHRILVALPRSMWVGIQELHVGQDQWKLLECIPHLDHEELYIGIYLDGVVRSNFCPGAVVTAPHLYCLWLFGPYPRGPPLRAWGVAVIARAFIGSIQYRSERVNLLIDSQLLADPAKEVRAKALAEADYLRADLLKHGHPEWSVFVPFGEWKV